MNLLYEFDEAIRTEKGIFAGVDEAGRGPLCGPVCVAAVILDPENPIEGVNDSKKLSEKKREKLFEEIKEKALAYSIVFVGPDIIDRDNILNASLNGMRQAVEELTIQPAFALVDGNRIPKEMPMETGCQVKGDAVSASIAAASILAKVSRDRLLDELDEKYPGYGLKKHKGYPTKAHYAALAELGPSEIHRLSFLKKKK